jgi:hypothetical protein
LPGIAAAQNGLSALPFSPASGADSLGVLSALPFSPASGADSLGVLALSGAQPGQPAAAAVGTPVTTGSAAQAAAGVDQGFSTAHATSFVADSPTHSAPGNDAAAWSDALQYDLGTLKLP